MNKKKIFTGLCLMAALLIGIAYLPASAELIYNQPDPQRIQPIDTGCSHCNDPYTLESPKDSVATIRFEKQMKQADLEEFVEKNQIIIKSLEWEWGDHKTYYPVSSEISLSDAMNDLRQYQTNYLKGLIAEIPEIQKDYAEKGITNDLDKQLEQFKIQLEYVKEKPIQVASIKVQVGNDTLKNLLVQKGITVVDYKSLNPDSNNLYSNQADLNKNEKNATESSVLTAIAGWEPNNGIFILNDTNTYDGPCIRNYINWTNISGFSSYPGYEHDVKVAPFNFTEAQNTHSIPVSPWVDPSGPWSTNFPSSAVPYLDTRWSDSTSGGKDFTIGIAKGSVLSTTTTYITTIGTNRASSNYSTANVTLQAQLERLPKPGAEQEFCNQFSPTLGFPQACMFVQETGFTKYFTASRTKYNKFYW
ncbi:Uncharacterized [Syntrophomonas zehnderi OL-4]|uniref:Uncharacterized n=1 Tax=Syntrophomonas zehnderi OL-4 TaxID=690567 RepID=A0A0E3W3Q1_9FIRM|nr:hypothetical protein [Syntrophomonas zehnderi]CFX97497.1 Uncharacterized [Syntrophomonas zehnderi OL-4]